MKKIYNCKNEINYKKQLIQIGTSTKNSSND